MKDEPKIPEWAIELAAAFKEAEMPSDAISANAIGDLVGVDGRRIKFILDELTDAGTMERFDVGRKMRKSYYRPAKGVKMPDVLSAVQARLTPPPPKTKPAKGK